MQSICYMLRVLLMISTGILLKEEMWNAFVLMFLIRPDTDLLRFLQETRWHSLQIKHVTKFKSVFCCNQMES